MTQINFYMSQQDEADFLAFVRSKGGYLARLNEKSGDFRVENENRFERKPFSDLKLFLSLVFDPSNLSDPARRMKSYHGHRFWGPGIDYQSTGLDTLGIVRARFWFEVSALNFLPAPPWEGGPPSNCRDRYSDAVKKMDGFYQSICRFIRKRYRSDGGAWHGPDSDVQEASGVPKFQFITEAGPVPQHGFTCECPKCINWRPDPKISPYRHWSEKTAFEQLRMWRGVAAHYEKRTAEGLKCQYKESDYNFSREMILEIEAAFPSLKTMSDGATT